MFRGVVMLFKRCWYTDSALAKLTETVHKYMHTIFNTDKATSADTHRKKVKSQC